MDLYILVFTFLADKITKGSELNSKYYPNSIC
jgi:hypothetical protein